MWRAGGVDWSEPEGRSLQVQRRGAGPLRLLLLAGCRQQDLPTGNFAVVGYNDFYFF